jgi:hypothetical protein
MSTRKYLGAVAVGVILTVGMGVSSAHAASISTAGARAEHVGSSFGAQWHNVYAHDTAQDGKFVSAPWRSNYGSSGSVVNKSGDMTSIVRGVTSGGERVTHINACRSNGGVKPMTCSAEKKTGW